MYSTQHTHSLSTAFHTLLKILIAWVPLSILDSKYSKLEYRFPYSTRVWVWYRANTQRWVEYRVWLSILDSKYSKLEYNFPDSTQNTQSLSTTSHTRLKILIGWVQLSILYSSMSTVSGKYSTMSRVSSMTFHTRLNILKAWVQLSILDSKYSKLEYNFPYSTQNTQMSTAFNTLLKILYSTQHNRGTFRAFTISAGLCRNVWLGSIDWPIRIKGPHYYWILWAVLLFREICHISRKFPRSDKNKNTRFLNEVCQILKSNFPRFKRSSAMLKIIL